MASAATAVVVPIATPAPLIAVAAHAPTAAAAATSLMVITVAEATAGTLMTATSIGVAGFLVDWDHDRSSWGWEGACFGTAKDAGSSVEVCLAFAIISAAFTALRDDLIST